MDMGDKFNILIEEGKDGYFLSEVLELPGCRTQAKSYDELLKRTKEDIELYLETKGYSKTGSKFLGLQQIEV